MTTVEQGFKYFILPPIVAVTAYKITRNVDLTIATFFGGMGVAIAWDNATDEQRQLAVKATVITFAALAVGTLLFFTTDKIEAAVPVGVLAGIGTTAFWPPETKQSKDSNAPLQPVQTQIGVINEAVKESLDTNTITALRLVMSNLEGMLKSLNGAAEQIKKEAKLALGTAKAFIDSFFSAKKRAEEAAKDKAMQVELENIFDVIKVDGDGSCMPRAILALVDDEIRPNLKNLDNGPLNLRLTPEVKKLRGNIAQFVRDHVNDEQVIRIVTNSFETKKVEPQVLDAYCHNIEQMCHWFGHGEMTLTAAHLKVNIATYSGAPVTDNQGKLSCSIVPLEKEDRHDKTIHIWLKQSTKHYWILLPKKEV